MNALDTQPLAGLGPLGSGTSCRAARRLCHAASHIRTKTRRSAMFFPWHGVCV
ncbi:hypothetical protein CU044_7668 [Streptomyces sp. L-9-10]|nr:hypothetical protein CU044_7668 [Streptomyces sp. L-9-10]